MTLLPTDSILKSAASPKRHLGLPGYYYTDTEVFTRELRTLWCSTWQFVGRVEDLLNPGDYLTCIIGEEPIFVIRTPEGRLKAMHNVCPHRGARLLDGQGNCNLVRCPYHAWTYDLEGKLLGVAQPKLFPDLDKSAIHLLPARVDTWGGFIFVNPDPQGESLIDYLAGFPAYLQQYDQSWEELRQVTRWSYCEQINWKFIVENYAEDYHFSTAHPQSLSMFDFQSIRTTPTGRHSQIYVPYVDQPPESSLKYQWEAQGGSYQGYIFPNIMINTAKDHVSVFRLVPLNPVSTCIEVLIYQTPAQTNEFPLDEATFRSNFDRVMEEDFEVCRLLQAGVNSRAYQVSQLAQERELGVAHFYKVLSKYI